MSTLRILIVSICFTVISCAPCTARPQARQPRLAGRLKVTLRNLDDSIIPPNKITVTSPRVLRTCLPDAEGSCEFELPAGIYSVSAQRCMWGLSDRKRVRECWYRFYRAPFRVMAGHSLWINLLPEDPYLGTYFPGLHSPPGFRKVMRLVADPPKYASIPLTASSPRPALTLVIQFRDSHPGKGFVQYGSTESVAGKPNVIASYDALTIYADSVRVSRNPLRLRAEGQVVIEDGKQREKARAVEMTFNNGAPVISAAN